MHLKEILHNIRAQREYLHLTQEFLACELDLTIKSYSNIENGHTELTLSRFLRIAEILNIPPNQFLQPSKYFTPSQSILSSHYNTTDSNVKSLDIDKNPHQYYIKHLEDEVQFLRHKMQK